MTNFNLFQLKIKTMAANLRSDYAKSAQIVAP